jgi:hypothetical protein
MARARPSSPPDPLDRFLGAAPAVRELRQLLERMVLLEPAAVIAPESLARRCLPPPGPSLSTRGSPPPGCAPPRVRASHRRLASERGHPRTGSPPLRHQPRRLPGPPAVGKAFSRHLLQRVVDQPEAVLQQHLAHLQGVE